jgi:hypothetical protein
LAAALATLAREKPVVPNADLAKDAIALNAIATLAFAKIATARTALAKTVPVSNP